MGRALVSWCQGPSDVPLEDGTHSGYHWQLDEFSFNQHNTQLCRSLQPILTPIFANLSQDHPGDLVTHIFPTVTDPHPAATRRLGLWDEAFGFVGLDETKRHIVWKPKRMERKGEKGREEDG